MTREPPLEWRRGGEELVFFGWPDLAGLMRGRGFPAADLDKRLETGIGWVPVAQAISPLSTLAPSPWGALGDVWQASLPPTQ